MGWFSDDDSEEDAPAASNPPQNDPTADDGEEDPLDAYMNSLDNSAPSKPTSLGERLDHDAEDEATSHWERKQSSNNHTDSAEEDDHDQQSSSREAKLAMSSTFVRAGDKKRPHDDYKHDLEGNDDDEAMQNLVLQHSQMQHQEITPLEKTNHTSIRYPPFRRNFLPQNHDNANNAESEAHATWRTQHEIICHPPIPPIMNFDADIFPQELIVQIAKSGYDNPTLVQCQTLGVALAGMDGLITAATGSGKTLAYIWPLTIHTTDQPHILPNEGPIALILCPTRELSKQVAKHAKIYMECMGGKVVEVSGGNRGTWELCKELKRGCEIVVGTPGRVIDVVRRKGTNLERVTFVVLDEADRMLDMGFEKQVSSILENIRPDRQTLLLSATFGKRVERVARGWLKNPVRIAIGRTGASSEHVDQHIMVLPSIESKRQWLVEMLPILAPLGRCIVFVATRDSCNELSGALQNLAIFSSDGDSIIVSIHGDKDQSDRNAAISKFKKNPRAVMIATDVASRGLDIVDVMTVINYDAAKNIDSHVHRVGRAGRMSKSGNDETNGEKYQKGVAYTLLTDKNADFAQSLVEAFEREGREISQDLRALCQKSNRFGGGRKKQSKVGLGFGGTDPTTYGNAMQQKPSFKGEGQDSRAKRSRWG